MLFFGNRNFSCFALRFYASSMLSWWVRCSQVSQISSHHLFYPVVHHKKKQVFTIFGCSRLLSYVGWASDISAEFSHGSWFSAQGVSISTVYLMTIVGIFLVVGLLHLPEFWCLFHGKMDMRSAYCLCSSFFPSWTLSVQNDEVCLS